jgi:hypothetical protein
MLRTSDPLLAALRVVALEHLLSCRLPQLYRPQPPPPPPRGRTAAGAMAAASGSGLPALGAAGVPGMGGAAAGGAASGIGLVPLGSAVGGGGVGPLSVPLPSLPLLPDLAALLGQALGREAQRQQLDRELLALPPGIAAAWQGCAPSLMGAACEVRLGPRHRQGGRAGPSCTVLRGPARLPHRAPCVTCAARAGF